MTKSEIKHALISLILGVLITALSSLILGALGILKEWVAGIIGGSGTSIVYYSSKFLS